MTYRACEGRRVTLALCLLGLATATLGLSGCIVLGSEPTEPIASLLPVTPTPRVAPPAPARSAAYPGFEKLRDDLLAAQPQIASGNCAFALGVDVSGSSHASGILEYTTKMLTDACRYFFAPGDIIVVIPWDSRVRESHVRRFEYEDTDSAVDDLNASFEDLENLVDPESRGSNLLDARGFCMERTLEECEGSERLAPVVLVFTDLRVPDLKVGKQRYDAARLTALRRKLAGANAEFTVRAYQAGEKRQVIVHMLAGPAKGTGTGAVDRVRGAGAAPVSTPSDTYVPPTPRPRDVGGFRVMLIVVALLSMGALIGLPFAWRHRISLGDVRETIRAFGGRVTVQSGRGISPRGVVFVPVPGLEDRPLVALEGKGPQIVAVARRGVRLNDGRTELSIPMGRPVTLRISIDGVPGEQELDVQVAGFLATNTGPIAGMIIALLVALAAIVG